MQNRGNYIIILTMNHSDIDERREHIRVSCRLDVEANTGKDWFLLNSKDISMGGMMLTTESDINKLKKLKIDVEKQVSLSFYLPNQSNLIKVFGKVRYIKRKKDYNDDKENSLIGIRFIKEISKQFNDQLEHFIYGKDKRVWI